jgi:hypothetical protein
MNRELSGIVGLEMEITRREGKYKLNQNRSREDRESVVRALEVEGDPLQSEVAALMRETLDLDVPPPRLGAPRRLKATSRALPQDPTRGC